MNQQEDGNDDMSTAFSLGMVAGAMLMLFAMMFVYSIAR